jgi:hypothetical protein
LSTVQDEASDQVWCCMPQIKDPATGFAHHGERLHLDFKVSASEHKFPKFDRLNRQFSVRTLLEM